MYKLVILPLLLLILLFPFQQADAQDGNTGPTYIIQPGDTLFEIAFRFGVTVNEIITVNNLENPDTLAIGDQIIIPGYDGIQGILEIRTIQLGEDFAAITLSERVDPHALSRLNGIASPSEVFVGRSLIVPSSDEQLVQRAVSNIGNHALIVSAARSQVNPWSLKLFNQKDRSWQLSGDAFSYTNAPTTSDDPSANSPFGLSISPLPLRQGKTTIISVNNTNLGDHSAYLGEQSLTFFQAGDQWIARIGIPATQTPGLLPFIFTETTADGQHHSYSQLVLLETGQFTNETVNGVESLTIDPQVIQDEDLILSSVISTIPDKLWDGVFQFPVDDPCVGSGFGNRRSYNNGAYLYFHTGMDFTICAADNLNVYTPAPGVVAFTGQLPIKGNFIVIDHGQGIMSGYAHLSEVMVNIGDLVDTGQTIGIIGNTGRSVGPHLHWEVWVNGVVVNPYDWIETAFQ